jgi:hypothetical protein
MYCNATKEENVNIKQRVVVELIRKKNANDRGTKRQTNAENDKDGIIKPTFSQDWG